VYDPQTSGGLLISVSSEEAGQLLSSLRDARVNAVQIGSVIESSQERGNAAIILK
jgi:selenophosphate synthase